MIKLSNQQQSAINCTNFPVLVVAGAGSGKTRTLIAKFIQLVDSGVDPKKILAITFTNKAASEMKSRLTDNANIQEKDLPWVKTYHSACLTILKKHCELVGLNKPIQILTSYHQYKLVKKLLINLNFDSKFTSSTLSHISNAVNTGSPYTYFNSNHNVSSIPFLKIYNLYNEALISKNAVDFDRILLLTRNLLRDNNKIRIFYRNFFQYILCDEYQDTNNLNEEITRLLINKKNLFVVGDDWQSIYSFRMSNVDHFLSFLDKYSPAKIFRLEENYRSTNKIVQLGNCLISFNNKQMKKLCYSKKKGGLIKICEFNNDQKEAFWVTKSVKTLHRFGIPYEKMAILYRTKFCSLPFEQALRKGNVPYQMLGGKGFFERMEILDLNCYLSAAVFDQDDISFERIINTPKRGIGWVSRESLNKIINVQEGKISLQQAAHIAVTNKILTPKLLLSLKNLLNLLNQVKKMNPNKALHRIISETNYIKCLEKYTKANSMSLTSRLENIEQLIHSTSKYNTIIEYLEEASMIREDRQQEIIKNDLGLNLSTIHRVKGLEFKVVFLVGCEEQLLPHWKSMGSKSQIEEERRLMYVAITRAQEYLFITSTMYRKGQHNLRSRFLNEIKKYLINI